jgi:acyl-CoA reductase-like NAD-dependent aldehyde dehydrogenase
LKKYKMWIDGKWVASESGKYYSVDNPATEEKIAEVPLGNAEDIDKAVEAARKAFPIWSKKTTAERCRILMRIANLMRKHTQELVDIDVLDHATPIRIARGVAGGAVPGHFEAAAELAKNIMDFGQIKLGSLKAITYLQREPIGVCACITPWNVPLMIAGDIAPALAAGNTCVLKPPSVDSLPILKIGEILAEEPDLPPGTVNIVTGPGGVVGEALASHPGVGIVSFTGSCETGKAIMAAASKTMKRMRMELGGKNPYIVLEDADIDGAVTQAAYVTTWFTGMICGAPGRFYLHEKIYDQFVSKFIERVKKAVVGDPNDEKTDMGPVVSAEHRDRVEGYIKSGIEQGAKLLLGGKRPTTPPLNKGYYILPTVLGDVTQNMTVAREEIFGPVACMMKFSSEDEVIKMANDNTFGLTAAVWTRNIAKGRRFANALQAGTVRINRPAPIGEGVISPWGGFKESGVGKSGDVLGFEEYTQVKVVGFDTSE